MSSPATVVDWYNALNTIHLSHDLGKVVPILCQDLKYVDQERVFAILEKDGDQHHAFKTIAEIIDSFEYNKLAGRLFMWWVYRNTPNTLAEYLDRVEKVSKTRPFFDQQYIDYCRRYETPLQKLLDETAHKSYLNVDYFAVATLWSKYSLRLSLAEQVERDSYLFLRVTVQLFGNTGATSLKSITDYYMRQMDRRILHASPTNFNACLTQKYRNLSSCFGVLLKDDINHIIASVQAMMRISVSTGGIGASFDQLREIDADIGTRGRARGVVSLIVMINYMIRYAHQGGFRNGVLNAQLSIFHPEILDFIKMRDDATPTEKRAMDLDNTILLTWPFIYYYKKYREGDYSKRYFPLFSPKDAPRLFQLRGPKLFEEFLKLVDDTSVKRELLDIDLLLKEINRVNRLGGHPYLVNIDSASFKSNHHEVEPSTVGPDGKEVPGAERFIMMTNLCLEIYEYNSATEIFSCNLFQISIKQYVKSREGKLLDKFDFDLMAEDIRAAIPAMTQVIRNNGMPLDNMKYVHEPCVDGEKPYEVRNTTFLDLKENNNTRNPIGGGWSGFADACYKIGISPVGENAILFGQHLAACYLFNALAASVDQAIIHGEYKTFEYSPMAKGKFQFDLWREETETLKKLGILTDEDIKKYRYPKWDKPLDPKHWGQKPITLVDGSIIEPNWESLRKMIRTKGILHSLLLAFMPSSTTSQFLCNTQASEVPLSNYYTRLTDYGSFSRVSEYLELELRSLGLWNQHTIDFLLANEGSLDIFHRIVETYDTKWFPDFDKEKNGLKLRKIQRRFKTAMETDPKDRLKFEAAIGRYVCQGSSLNWFVADPTDEILNELLLEASLMGLKTIKYYLRTKDVVVPGRNAILDPEMLRAIAAVKGDSYINKLITAHAKQCKKEDGQRSRGIKVLEISGVPEMPLSKTLETAVSLKEDDGPVCRKEEGCINCS